MSLVSMTRAHPRQTSRHYAGGSSHCGVRARRQQVCSREDARTLRDAFSDFLREKKLTLRTVNRSLQRDWQPGYLAALERTGDPEESCRRAGAVLEKVEGEIQRDATLRAKCALAVARFTARIKARAQRRSTRQLEIAT